jgi:hypothetical protein
VLRPCWRRRAETCWGASRGCRTRGIRAGVRHPLAAVLALCTAAVLSGNTSLEDVTAWVYHAPQPVLAACRARRAGLRAYVAPHPDTVVRVLAALGAQELAHHAGAYLAVRAAAGR